MKKGWDIIKILPAMRSRLLGAFLCVLQMTFLFHQVHQGCYASIFEKTSTKANSLAGTALSGDLTGVTLNPVNIVLIDKSQIVASYIYLDEKARYNTIAYGERFNKFSLGILFTQLYRGEIEVRRSLIDEPSYTSLNKIGGLISAGVELPYKFSAGGNIKFLHYEIYDVKSNVGFGMDLGVYRNMFSYGDILKNKIIFNTGIGITDIFGPVITLGNEKEKYNTTMKISCNAIITLFPKYDFKKETLFYDELKVYLDYGKNFTTGLEYKKEKYFIRCGYNPDTFKKFTFGAGAELGNIVLNYTWIPFIEIGLHSLEIVYEFGSPKLITTPEELEDYLNVHKKAQRIYNRYIREAESLIKAKQYDVAIQYLEKILPLFPEKKEAKDLVSICENSIISEKLNKIYMEYTNNIAQGLYIDAYENILAAIEFAAKNNVPKQMIDDFKKQIIPASQKRIIEDKQQKFVTTISKNIEYALSNYDFEFAHSELEKLNIIEPYSENTYLQKRKIESAKREYVNELVRKGIEFSKEHKYSESYVCFKEAYRASKDDLIKNQMKNVKEKLKKPALYEEIYQRKLYLLAALSYAEDDYLSARETLFELRRLNVAFDYDQLEEALIKQKIIIREIP